MADVLYVTDSTICLHWIHQDDRPLQVAIRNAVIEVRRFSEVDEWVHVVLAAYIADTPPPPGIVPVILLDAYRVHMCQAVVDSIQALGIEVIHIPGGCTGILQPLDVGINRPYKVRIRAKWEEWMMDTIDRYGEIRPPTREDVSAWAAETHWEMQGLPLMQNAWRKTDYSWFPNDDPAGANIILGDSFTDTTKLQRRRRTRSLS